MNNPTNKNRSWLDIKTKGYSARSGYDSDGALDPHDDRNATPLLAPSSNNSFDSINSFSSVDSTYAATTPSNTSGNTTQLADALPGAALELESALGFDPASGLLLAGPGPGPGVAPSIAASMPPSVIESPVVVTDGSDVVATTLGVDPGFASTGVGAISRLRDGRIISRGCWLIKTAKDHNSGVRAGMDDARRIREFWAQLREAVAWIKPNAMGVETYETRRPKAVDDLRRAATTLVQLGLPSSRDGLVAQLADDRIAKRWIESIGAIGASLRDDDGWAGVGLGNAAKTIGVVWTSTCVAFEANIPLFTYTPTMLKQRLSGTKQASKQSIGALLEARIEGLAEHTAQTPAGQRDHVWDATGHALLTLAEYEQWQAAYAPR